MLDILGKGAYGLIWQVKEKGTSDLFLLKKVIYISSTF
jgi:hypothetical protein